MKILYFTKYSRKGASSRVRSFQYFPFLQREGIEVTVSPLFDDEYLVDLYSNKVSKWNVAKGYLRRLYKLLSVKQYNKIFIEYELFPYLPVWGEFLLKLLGVKYIVDYDDAIFHNYDLSTNKIIRSLLGKKIDKVMRYSSTVIAGNNYLADRAKKAGAKRIEIIPTVIDIDRYGIKKGNNSDRIIIGWIGSPFTLKYIKSISTVLQFLVEKYKVEICIVGAKADIEVNKNIHYINWEEDTEVASISNFDIGIMPLVDSPWEQGKCSYKLIQYMACGVPVVASQIGMNKEVVTEGENGFLVNTKDEWLKALELYIQSPEMRLSHGLEGREKVKEKYCVQVTHKLLVKALREWQ